MSQPLGSSTSRAGQVAALPNPTQAGPSNSWFPFQICDKLCQLWHRFTLTSFIDEGGLRDAGFSPLAKCDAGRLATRSIHKPAESASHAAASAAAEPATASATASAAALPAAAAPANPIPPPLPALNSSRTSGVYGGAAPVAHASAVSGTYTGAHMTGSIVSDITSRNQRELLEDVFGLLSSSFGGGYDRTGDTEEEGTAAAAPASPTTPPRVGFGYQHSHGSFRSGGLGTRYDVGAREELKSRTGVLIFGDGRIRRARMYLPPPSSKYDG